MKKGYLGIGVITLGLLFLSWPNMSLAQNEGTDATMQATEPSAAEAPMVSATAPSEGAAAAPEATEEDRYTFGTVDSVSDKDIAIQEYDYDNDQDIKVTYAVSADTKFYNVASVTELAKGDSVEIYYKEADGQKTATMISKEEVKEDTGEAPWDTNADIGEESAPTPLEAPSNATP